MPKAPPTGVAIEAAEAAAILIEGVVLLFADGVARSIVLVAEGEAGIRKRQIGETAAERDHGLADCHAGSVLQRHVLVERGLREG